MTKTTERELVADLLSVAFESDPILAWLLPGRRNTLLNRRRLFDHSVGIFVRDGVLEVTADGKAAATWGDPHAPRPSRVTRAFDRIRGGIAALRSAGGASDRATRLFEAMQAHRPRAPHWYLASIGTRPEARGQGAASALLGARLEVCDREGIPAYLESSNPRNLPLYERHGFEILRKITVGDSPPLWLMTRPPHRLHFE